MAFGRDTRSLVPGYVEAPSTHRVWLVLQDEQIVDGLCSYRCDELPHEGDVITVEDVYMFTPACRQARVTQVRPASGFPISATQL